MKLVWTSAAVLLLVVAAPAGTQGQEPDYFPLRTGATWTYEANDKTITVKLTKQEEKKIGKAMVTSSRLETSYNNMPPSSEEIANLPQQGLCRIAINDKPVTPPLCFLELPPKKGKDWRWKVNAKWGNETITGEFVASEQDVKVDMIPYFAGKTEKTVKLLVVQGNNLKVNGQAMGLTCYFAPDVGIVKQEGEVAGVKFNLRLKSFDVNK